MAAALGASLVGALYAFVIEPLWVDWHDETILIPGLPSVLDGFQIIQLSDLHAYGGISPRMLARIVEHCNRQSPDLVAITGDLVNHCASAIPQCAAQLSEIRARYGALAILGGHDYESWAAASLIDQLETAGIGVIHNRAVPVGPERNPLWVAGLDDNSNHGCPDLDAALRDIPAGAPHILLMHSPDDALEAAERRVPLVLAGHTHGGQVCLPFLGPMVTCSRFGRRFARGRHYLNGTVLYICRGLGSHRHVRLLSRPEVVRFTLRRA